ncbi:3-hydroxyacyl-CoA dehydrogenase, C-terminal,6-phosphogluconate dehydrogenase C-terminal domain- [Cinara cedri]|uniref:3-hydroxyacyl-CoA dehydrogenase n=1 Tax=Cinara cedri TaxID=506608 RepID=A0A5E4MA74_9HEMI|nr:3-hydroxyacyl-CoA dehydrogenase, C-terminal,6-phosphogluconate dehydrogenase C-terminal domain- [Cinara cedri]
MSCINVISRNFSTSVVARAAIKNVTVVGGGLMGSGIAQVSAQSGHNVTIVELNQSVLDKTYKSIENSLQRIAKKTFKENPNDANAFVSEALSRISTSTDLPNVVQDSDLVLEAIVENLSVKHKLFKSIDETPETSDETYQKLMAWGKAIGKTTITCKDTPGFVVNRLLLPLMAEAIRMLERGDASPRDIDIAMKLGAGHPMGPIELADYVGHDTNNSIINGWHDKFPENPLFEPLKSLQKLVDEKKLGIKTGEGYYSYKK